MQLSLVAVGKLRPTFREVCDDYLARLARFVRVIEREVREAGRAGTEAQQREVEGVRLIEAIDPQTPIVLLDLAGAKWSSEQLAVELDRWRLEGRDRAIVIGGATGVSAAVRERAQVTWSLGPLTLPHELARVVVLEQLYRASTILQGTPYHKGAR